jgi:hypothetical protein
MKLEGLYADIFELIQISNKADRIKQFKYLLKEWGEEE